MALIPWLAALENVSWPTAGALGYFWGLVFFLGSCEWLRHVHPLGWILACLYLAVYSAAFGVLASWILKRPGRGSFTACAGVCLAWFLTDLTRQNIPTLGFGWNALGYALYEHTKLIQIADRVSITGLSAMVVAVSAAIWAAWRRGQWGPAVVVTALWFAVFSYGAEQVMLWAEPGASQLTVGLIQPNVPQDLKWDPELIPQHYRKLLTLSEPATKQGRIDLVVWPETAYPGDWERQDAGGREPLAELARRAESFFIIGSPTYDPDDRAFYNSAFLIDPAGATVSRYDKMRLVPFGEYLPWPRALSWLKPLADALNVGDFKSGGRRASVFDMERFAVAPLICFEDIFPSLVRERVRRGAQILAVMTNDAWFGRGGAAEQHLAASVLRAVENRVPVVRAANTGVTCVIDPAGRVVARLAPKGKDQFVEGIITYELRY